MEKLGINQVGGHGIYLGLPESFEGSNVSILSYLKEKLEQKLGGWQNRFLSPAGKEVLLKAVALALPTYTMSCFLLPKTLCKKIVALMADFWWKNNKDSRGMHWKTWSHMRKPKEKGGLGFKDLEDFNMALLEKQLWRLITHPNSLLARVFKSGYYKSSDPLNASLGSRPSYAWRSMMAAQKPIKQGAKVAIGNGRKTKLWEEQWLGRKPAFAPRATSFILPQYRQIVTPTMTVVDLMNDPRKEWNIVLIENIFPENIKEQILATNIQGSHGEDTYYWEYTKTIHYTVKSGYWVQQSINKPDQSNETVDQPSLDGLFQ